MERMIHNDYRQPPITSDDGCAGSRAYLATLEEMIAAQEDVIIQARVGGDACALAHARTRLWRLLTKRQGVVDALQAYEERRVASH
jgi:hypothetical protein